jgi:CSLREA domain-containing protein
MKKEMFHRFTAVLLILLVIYALQSPRSALAATITVNTTADEFDVTPNATCSLREAIRSANTNMAFGGCSAGAGDDVIDLPEGTYTLTLTGVGENNTATGDLDILSNMTINGAGAAATIIDGNSLDRVFEIRNNANVTFNDVTISGGVVSGPGGGIHVSSTAGGSLNIIRSIIVNNTANGNNGGALFVGTGTATITDSAFINNVSTVDGGGILIGGGTTTITNSTISGNNADGNGGGIALASATITSLSLVHVTVTSNTADADTAGGGDGGGIRQSGTATTLTVSNSIIAGNVDNTTFAANDCSRANGTFNTGDYNLRPSNTGCQTFLSGVYDFDVNTLGLIALGNNGGTPTHALQSNSDALDRIPSGTNGCGTTYTDDQRGAERPQDVDGDGTAACEIGAFESEREETCGLTDNSSVSISFVSGNEVDAYFTEVGDMDCFSVNDWLYTHPNATGPSDPPNDVDLATGEWWDITAEDTDGQPASGFNLNLTLPHDNLDDPSLCKFPGTQGGSGWDCYDPDSETTSAVTLNGITELSAWAVGESVGPTAVSLQSFQVGNTPIVLVSIGTLLALLLLTASLLWRRRTAIMN